MCKELCNNKNIILSYKEVFNALNNQKQFNCYVILIRIKFKPQKTKYPNKVSVFIRSL